MRKIVITGAAGLVGQNLVARLKRRNDLEPVGIDKHTPNLALFRELHPGLEIVEADLAEPGDWSSVFEGVDTVVINHAQIGGLFEREFVANNETATVNVIEAARRHGVGHLVHVSSSVVNSSADDFYTRSKANQERLVRSSGIPHVVLRPTLMFGWFDRKHLGWLRRFMDRTPVFPIPGNGRYVRQPLYVGDFVAVIEACLDRRASGVHDISGLERIEYGDLIRLVKEIVGARTAIVSIPYRVFWWLLRTYALFDREPPFTTRQLEALVIPETFPVTDWPGLFGVEATPLRAALEETYRDPRYSAVTLAF
jgi:nucleoside-diphosphate-sugar epimerase